MKHFWLIALSLALSSNALADNTRDPYEPYNRTMFQFNEVADRYVMTPVAKGYRAVTPQPVRSAVRNFFDNLRDVHSFGANVLRGDIAKAGNDFMRVAFNTTFGLGGLINFADAVQMPNNKNTLGDTFASWGWKDSNYLVLPLLGPSTVRDGVGTGISTVYTPEALIHENGVRYGLSAVNAVDKRESLIDETETLNQMALDKYSAMRDIYIGMRNQQIGVVSETNSDEELTDPELVDPEELTDTEEQKQPETADKTIEQTVEQTVDATLEDAPVSGSLNDNNQKSITDTPHAASETNIHP